MTVGQTRAGGGGGGGGGGGNGGSESNLDHLRGMSAMVSRTMLRTTATPASSTDEVGDRSNRLDDEESIVSGFLMEKMNDKVIMVLVIAVEQALAFLSFD